MAQSPGPDLRRGMTLLHATALVVGGMLGTGVYLRSALMAQQVGSAPLVLLAWLAAGLVSMTGALTYAELSARLPRTGGEYVFLREAFGPLTAFLFGWTRTIVGAASQAAVAVAFATFLGSLVPPLAAWAAAVAAAAVGAITGVNCLGVVAGARVQTALTAAKVVALGGLIGGALVFAPDVSLARLVDLAPQGPASAPGVAAFGGAMVGALWAYAGWNNLPMTAGEIVDPVRTLPRAIIGGALGVTALYLAVNAVYFVVLPFDAVATANSVAHPQAPAVGVKAAQGFLGGAGASVLLVAFCVSAFGTLNGMILTTARIGFAMARDGLLPARLGVVGGRTRAPVVAIAGLGALTAVLALVGTLDRLATGATLGYWVFHTLCGLALFALRRRATDAAPGAFRVPGYPIVPAVFVACGSWLLISSLWTSPIEARWVLAVLASGVPAYLMFARRRPGSVLS
jgi:APA family basic amino acid/polyamine antiporter